MHRAEKASSKICRDREVEKAQELHRRKIDGVKSYLTAITRPPPAAAPPVKKATQSATFYRRSQRQQAPPASPDPASGDHVHFDAVSCTSDGEYESDEQYDDDSGDHEDVDKHQAPTSKSFAKLDELRSVLVPVMAYKGDQAIGDDLNYERLLDGITASTKPVHAEESEDRLQQSPRHPRHPSAHFLRAKAFRMRRLKQIENDNITLFDRIKNSSAHYRADAFKRDWDQNMAYLTSICEFPLLEETVQPHPPRRQNSTRKQTPFTARLPEQLPSLQHTPPSLNHPIRANPSSPRKPRQLNLSPAFRSLRKGLPQAPSLPPLTASPRASAPVMTKSVTAVAGSRPAIAADTKLRREAHQKGSQSVSPRTSPPTSEPSERCTTDYDGESRYTLLKLGRFVGGKYLVLTVFCGDGITNPYGFDVVALDPETQVEFHLSITKETTHLLIDTISSSSMAQRTAAAAGTNLSMELIARCICEHVRYAFLGSCEVVFLVATVGARGGLTGDEHEEILHTDSEAATGENCHLLLGTSFSAMAFCFHQVVRLPPDGQDGLQHRTLHVFATTRPPQCCRATMEANPTEETMRHDESDTYGGLVCYQVGFGEHLPSDSIARPSRHSLSLHLRVHELISQCETAGMSMVHDASVRLSLDRFIMLSLSHLHLRRESDTPHLDFDCSTKNNWSAVLPMHRSPTNAQKSRSHTSPGQSPTRITRASLDSEASHIHTGEDRIKTVVQTGVLWRGAFILARIALLCPCRFDEETGLVEFDPVDEKLVINIFNSSTKKYSERTMDGEQVEILSQKLGAWQIDASSEGVPPLVTFVKRLLVRLRLDVDLRGHEVVCFPSLEPRRQPSSGRLGHTNSTTRLQCGGREGRVGSTKPSTLQAEFDQQNQAVTLMQALIRGYLWRRRLRRRKEPPTKVPCVLLPTTPSFVHSLLPKQQSFVRNRAAKQIQFACRGYAGRAAKAKSKHFDPDGRIILTPRALTPSMGHMHRSRASAELNGSLHGIDYPRDDFGDNLEGDVLGTVVKAEVEDGIPRRTASLRQACIQRARRQGLKSVDGFVLRRTTSDSDVVDRTISELGGLT